MCSDVLGCISEPAGCSVVQLAVGRGSETSDGLTGVSFAREDIWAQDACQRALGELARAPVKIQFPWPETR